MTHESSNHVDILIAGGGAAGSALALGLCEHTSLSVAVIENKPFVADQSHPGFDARSVALAADTCERLAHMGLSDIASMGSPIRHIHVSDKGYLGQVKLHAREYQLDALGRVVEMHQLGNQLNQALARFQQTGQLNWVSPDQIEDVTQRETQSQVSLKSGQVFSCKLLVIAEGAQSSTRAKLGITSQEKRYNQTALIANVVTSCPHNGWAYERFTEHGPLALLPLPEINETSAKGRWSLVWSLTPEQAEEYQHCNETQFLTALQHAFGYRAGVFEKTGQRHTYPLSLHVADSHVAHRAVNVANSAQALHPIAGQGLNLGIRDVDTLLNTIRIAVADGKDIGGFQTLKAFADARSKDQSRVVKLTDGLVTLFSNQWLPLVVGRNLGLMAMNKYSSLKGAFARQAMGQQSE